MKTLAIGELKAGFSAVLDEVAHGHPVAVGRGRTKKKVAVIVSYADYIRKSTSRKLGVLEKRASYRVREDLKISEEEFLEA